MANRCLRGKDCRFLHDSSAHPQQPTGSAALPSTAISDPPVSHAESSNTNMDESSVEKCTICLEIPIQYGLLVNCSHVFCLGRPFTCLSNAVCIRKWRNNKDKSEVMLLEGYLSLSLPTLIRIEQTKNVLFVENILNTSSPPFAFTRMIRLPNKPKSQSTSLQRQKFPVAISRVPHPTNDSVPLEMIVIICMMSMDDATSLQRRNSSE